MDFFISDRYKNTILYYVTKNIPERKEQLQCKLNVLLRIYCVCLGDYFSKHTKKTVTPQKKVELLEENEDDSKIPGQSSPPKTFGSVHDIRGYTKNECNKLADENKEGIKKDESIMDMLKDYSLVSKPILSANARRINPKSLLPNEPLKFLYPTCVFNNR